MFVSPSTHMQCGVHVADTQMFAQYMCARQGIQKYVPGEQDVTRNTINYEKHHYQEQNC